MDKTFLLTASASSIVVFAGCLTVAKSCVAAATMREVALRMSGFSIAISALLVGLYGSSIDGNPTDSSANLDSILSMDWLMMSPSKRRGDFSLQLEVMMMKEVEPGVGCRATTVYSTTYTFASSPLLRQFARSDADP